MSATLRLMFLSALSGLLVSGGTHPAARADTSYDGQEKGPSIRTASDLKKHWNTPGFWSSSQARALISRQKPQQTSTGKEPARAARQRPYWERTMPSTTPPVASHRTQLSYAVPAKAHTPIRPMQRGGKVARTQIIEWVETYADRYGIERNVVMAMMRNESAFNARAVSRANAVGLMQLVPTAGGREALSYKKGVRATPSRTYLFDPEKNVELGVIYLHLLNTEYFGGVKDDKSRLYAIISAYNTGPSNVAVGIVGRDDIPAAVRKINRMEAAQVYAHLRRNLPARETRTYLRRVVRDMPRYAHLNRVGAVARR